MPAPQPHDKILFLHQAATNPWIENYYYAELSEKNEATIDAYLRILWQVTAWGPSFREVREPFIQGF